MTEIPRPSWYKGKHENPRIGVAISNIGPMSPAFVGSLLAVIKDATFKGYVINTYLDQNKPLDDSRNMTVKVLMENDPDYIFFADADMMFPENILQALMEVDKPIVTGIYFQKNKPYHPVLRMWNEDNKHFDSVWNYPRGQVFNVDACGAGALLVKAEVFKKLKKPYFRWDYEKGISEDIYFCKKATDAGYDIAVAGHVECGHIAEMRPITAVEFWATYMAYEELKKQNPDKATWETKTYDLK